MTEAMIAKKVHDYLIENIDAEFDRDTEIFEEGLVNSLFAIQLMTFLEKEFNIKVTMDDLDMDNYKSVHAIAGFVHAKRQPTEV